MDPNKQLRPPRKRPEVFKKINSENLLVIERGLLGDVPEKLRPQPQVPVRTRPTELQVTKQSDLVSYPPIISDSPELEVPTPNEGTSSPILKKSFSFRNKFSRLSFFAKDKPHLADRWNKIDEDTVKKDVMDNLTSSKAPDNKYNSKDKDQEYKSKRFWMFKSKNEKKNERPTYKRSKSFEFLPRALDEIDEVNPIANNLTTNRHSFINTSNDTLNYLDTDDNVFETSHKKPVFDLYKGDEFNITGEKHTIASFSIPHDDSSLSTINTSTNSSIKLENSLLGPSFLDLCQHFDKTVELFNENYLSDSEPYTKENRDNNVTKEMTKKEKRKSSSFSSLPSPKVLHLNTVKVTEISDDFKNELLKVTSERSAQKAYLESKSARRGSVTDWFVLEEPSRLASDDNRYRRAQKKPINRVRRMSSTKYWITPEECAVYTREQRPPLVIPRITQYRPPRHERRPQNHVHCYPEENLQDTSAPVKSSVKSFERQDWSPHSDIDRGHGKFYESPFYNRLNKKLSGSSENLLTNNKRPNQLNLPTSSSGDSLDVEIRENKEPNRNGRAISMGNHRGWSPVPAPRMLVHQPAEAAVLCEGPVKRTKFWDKGKKCKKNWTECYMILTTTALVFYKDQKTYYATKIPKPPGTPPSPNAPRAELVLPLKSAHVVPCIEQHTRRYRRSINLTVDYDAYLLQDDTDEGSKQWLNRIQAVIYRLGPPTSDYLQIQSSNTDLESLGRTPPVSRHHTKNKPKAGGSSNEDLSDTTEVSHVRSILRKFFTKRPAMEVLVKKGIYKDEPVFGRNLEEVCPNISPRVPDFVVACISEIEKNEENMTTDGLYRASGNLSQVQKIRLEIDQNNMSVIENYPDIHVLTGSLKLFFRELKEPLIPCKLFDRVLSACSIKPKEAKIKEFRDIVHALPPCNRETLKYLLEHLLRVTTYSERNRMHTANLAIVFGPTLLWAPMEQAHNIAIDCIQQNNVVDILLTDFKEIFAEENVKGKKKS